MGSLEPGTVFAQRYEIEAAAGRGGMGTVFRARDRTTGDSVALKIIANAEAGSRFDREAQLLAEVRHPGIVAYVAHGLTPDGERFLAMEWLDGIDLAARLRAGPLTVGETVTLAKRIAAALSPAHQRGIVHRDLKPSNLFLVGGEVERVKILDFGIARRAVSVGLTGTGTVIGTPGYMAPEQARGARDITPAADVFSLGCVLYECLLGATPFGADHLAAALVKILFEDPTRISQVRPSTPSPLSRLVMQMLNKAVEARPPDASALETELAPLDVATGQPRTPSSREQAVKPAEQSLYSVAVAVPSVVASSATIDARQDATSSATLLATLRTMGAQVDQLGDGTLIAVIGQSESASDQAVLAARLGMAMRSGMPGARVAVATGRGHVQRQQLLGEAMRRAVDLLADAPASGVWADELTADLVAGRIAVRREDGRVELLHEDHNLDESRRLIGLPTPCVGREQELALLEAALAGCIDERSARAVGVVATPGMGKSRLRHEFLRRARLRCPELTVIHGRGDLMAAGSPYAIAVDGFLRVCGVHGGEPLADRQARVRARIAAVLPADQVNLTCYFLGQMSGDLGFTDDSPLARATRDDPRILNDQIAQAFMRWMRAEAGRAPTLLILEDFHWGDSLSVQLCERLLRGVEDAPLFVLALARPEVQQLFPSFWNAQFLQELPLRGLSRRASERLVVDVLERASGAPVSAEVVARAVTQSSGHPLYLEELIRAIVAGNDASTPQTVLAMLQARLSRMDPMSRMVLRAGSVFGERFADLDARALLGDEVSETALEQTLAALVRSEVVERSDTLGAYKFRHALVRDAAYSLFTDEDRALAHRLAGRHLEELGEADPAVVAEHTEKGGDRERAGRLWLRAGERAQARFDVGAALRYAAAAESCVVSAEEHAMAQALSAWAAYFAGDLPGGYERALAATPHLRPGSRQWAQANIIIFYSVFMLSRYEGFEERVRDYLAWAPDPEARASYLEAYEAITVLLGMAGARAASQALAARMSQVAAELEPEQRAHYHNAESWRIISLEQDPGRGLDEALTALALARAQNDRGVMVLSLLNSGMAYCALGDFERSQRSLREGYEVARAAGADFMAVVIRVHLGMVLSETPSADAKLEARAIGLEMGKFVQMGPPVIGACAKILGRVYLDAGELDAALKEQEVALANFPPVATYRFDIDAVQIRLLLALGRRADARAWAEDSLGRLSSIGGTGYAEVAIRLAAAEAFLADGDVTTGKTALADAHEALRRRADALTSERRASFLAREEHRRLLEHVTEHPG